MTKALILVLLILVGGEAWRLSSPETVQLRQTWVFKTTTGPVSISNVIELRQWASIAYLPGGAFGKSETIGQIPVSVLESGERYFISSDPRILIGNTLRSGHGAASQLMKGITNEHTTAFIRLLRKGTAEIRIPIAGSGSLRDTLGISKRTDGWGGLAGERMSLTDFEAMHPGFRLISINYRVTNAPADK